MVKEAGDLVWGKVTLALYSGLPMEFPFTVLLMEGVEFNYKICRKPIFGTPRKQFDRG